MPEAHRQPPDFPDELRWEVRQRLILLEMSLILLGRVNSNALIRRFGISRAQASKDLALYQKLRPANLVYDRFVKNYVITADFRPLLVKGTSDEIFALLRAGISADGAVVVLSSGMPPVEVLEPAHRRVDVRVLSSLCRAIHAGEKIELAYQSLEHAEPARLWLSPHALVYNGFRWHMRGWSENTQSFRDYVLARIRSEPVTVGLADCGAGDDEAWQSIVVVRVAPHPGLTANQRQVIADDFGMMDDYVDIPVRAALIPYYLRLMRIGLGDESREPKIQQIVLANKDEVMPFVTY